MKRTPNIRFKGFDGDWEEKALENIVLVNSGRDYKSLSAGSVPVYGTGGLMCFVDRSLSEIDAVGLGRKGTIDKPQFLKAPFWTVDTLFFLTIKGDVALRFVLYLCQSINWKKYDESTGVPSLSKNNINAINVYIPNNIEQKQIAILINSLDTLISQRAKEVEKMRNIKRALLEKMFPQDGEPVPQIRFKEFTGDWEIMQLGNLADKITKKNSSREITETFTNSAEFGIISQRDFFDHNISNENNTDGYYVVENNDFVYNPRISASAPVGPINRNKLGRAGIMSPLYTVFRSHDIECAYLEWFFKGNTWHVFMKLNGNNGARLDRFSISDNVFWTMPIAKPHKEEQTKIAKLLQSLDTTISTRDRQITLLKNLKLALLEQMFVNN